MMGRGVKWSCSVFILPVCAVIGEIKANVDDCVEQSAGCGDDGTSGQPSSSSATPLTTCMKEKESILISTLPHFSGQDISFLSGCSDPHLIPDDVEKYVHAFVSSRMDYTAIISIPLILAVTCQGRHYDVPYI